MSAEESDTSKLLQQAADSAQDLSRVLRELSTRCPMDNAAREVVGFVTHNTVALRRLGAVLGADGHGVSRSVALETLRSLETAIQNSFSALLPR